MASDRRPFSSRLKSLAQRAGLPVDDAAPEPREPAVVVSPVGSAPPVTTPVAPPPSADATPDDEQPTGDVPVVSPASPSSQLAAMPDADEQHTVATDALPSPSQSVPTDDPFAHVDGPTLAPPVVPARPVDEPGEDATDVARDADTNDDEPFSPRSTIWPQTTPTLRFEPEPAAEPEPADQPAGNDAGDATFPAASAVQGDDAEMVSPPPDAAPSSSPAPTDRSDASDVTTEQPALSGDPSQTGRGRVLGGLRRLRGDRATATPAATTSHATATATDTTDSVQQSSDGAAATPTEPQPQPEPEPIAAPAVAAPAPEPYEPPAKPSFTERAALRRRAKTLRARRDGGLLELGAIVLDQRRFGDPTGGSLQRRRTDELADIDSELAAIEQVLDDDGPAETVAQLGVVRCLSCSALVGPRDRFCAQCGSPRPDDADASHPRT